MAEALFDTNVLIRGCKENKRLQGFTTVLNLIEFPKALTLDLQVLFPSSSDFKLALRLSTELYNIGSPIPTVDVVIAAMALNRGLRLVTMDKHFFIIQEVNKDFQLDYKLSFP